MRSRPSGWEGKCTHYPGRIPQSAHTALSRLVVFCRWIFKFGVESGRMCFRTPAVFCPAGGTTGGIVTHYIHSECVGCGACKRVCPVFCIEGEQKKPHTIDTRKCIDCGACGIVCPVSCIADPSGKKYQFLKPKERPWAEVDQSICSGCQYCTDICPFDCLEIIASPGDGYATALAFNAHKNHCVSCKLCVTVCPKDTISIIFPDSGGERKRA